MLLGRMPGDSSPAELFAVLPSYGALLSRYLDRFGPYRLQPYTPPTPPVYSTPASVPPLPPLPSAVPPAAAKQLRHPGMDRGHDRRVGRRAFDPVGAGPSVLSGYDRAIAIGEALANPLGLGIGFSNPSLGGVVGLGLRELSESERQKTIDKINDARAKGLINDANRRVAPGTPIGRAGGVGKSGVSGGFGASNRGPGSRKSGFKDHAGGPR